MDAKLREIFEGKVGNYIVYFPSYQYLTDVYEIFTKKYPLVKLLQKRNISALQFLSFYHTKKRIMNILIIILIQCYNY